MPCAAYDKNGKLVMLIAKTADVMTGAKADKAIQHPDTRIIATCRCEAAHPGLADAVECDTSEADVISIYPPDELTAKRAIRQPNQPTPTPGGKRRIDADRARFRLTKRS